MPCIATWRQPLGDVEVVKVLGVGFRRIHWCGVQANLLVQGSDKATAAYLMAPRTVSLPRSLRLRLSVGSPSFLMSHHSTLPSVDTDIHSVPVLDCSHAKSYTGSLQDQHAGWVL